MLPLKLTRPLVVLDLETTGVDFETDRIVQFALLTIAPEKPATRVSRLVYPEMSIPQKATDVHRITNDDVRTHPPFKQFAPLLAPKLTGVDFAGYSVTFDLQMLDAEFRRAGVEWSPTGAAIVDGYRLWQELEPRELTDAVRHWCGEEQKNAHDAMADVMMTAKVLRAQVERLRDHLKADRLDETQLPENLKSLPALGNVEPSHLHELCFSGMIDLAGKFKRREDGVIVCMLGKFRETPIDDVPSDFLSWMLSRSFSPDTKQFVQSVLESRDERFSFEQAEQRAPTPAKVDPQREGDAFDTGSDELNTTLDRLREWYEKPDGNSPPVIEVLEAAGRPIR